MGCTLKNQVEVQKFSFVGLCSPPVLSEQVPSLASRHWSWPKGQEAMHWLLQISFISGVFHLSLLGRSVSWAEQLFSGYQLRHQTAHALKPRYFPFLREDSIPYLSWVKEKNSSSKLLPTVQNILQQVHHTDLGMTRSSKASEMQGCDKSYSNIQAYGQQVYCRCSIVPDWKLSEGHASLWGRSLGMSSQPFRTPYTVGCRAL